MSATIPSVYFALACLGVVLLAIVLIWQARTLRQRQLPKEPPPLPQHSVNMSAIPKLAVINRRVSSSHDTTQALVDCNEVIDNALEGLWDRIVGTDSTIVAERLPKVWGNAPQLAYVFQSVIDSAIRYRWQSKPHIHIRAQRERAFWRFEVYERNPHTPNTSGTAELSALTQAQDIIEGHGGEIWIEASTSRDARLVFTLPIAPPSIA